MGAPFQGDPRPFDPAALPVGSCETSFRRLGPVSFQEVRQRSMNIPPYWAKARAEVSQNWGRKSDLCAWGWSAEGQAQAEDHARRRLSSLLARIEAGERLPRGYGYGNRPLREEIVDRIDAASGGTAVVTRNAYGCLVLNTENVLFLDIDIPRRSATGLLRSLLGGAKPSPEEKILAQLKDLLRQVGNASFRIYRTAAGYRVLATDPTYAQGDRTVLSLLAHPLVDRAYAKLCEVQQSFRARLTPKPWRCGCERPPSRFPFHDESDQIKYNEWLADYDHAAATHSTCALVEEVGWGRVGSEIAPLLALHDRIARVDSGLPLA